MVRADHARSNRCWPYPCSPWIGGCSCHWARIASRRSWCSWRFSTLSASRKGCPAGFGYPQIGTW